MTGPTAEAATEAGCAAAESGGSRLTVSLRETRVLVERILLLLGVPKGAVPAVRDLLVEAEALGLGALAFLDSRAHPDSWRAAELASNDASNDASNAGGRAVIEAHGMPAPYVAPALLDLGVALLREHGRARIEVRGLSAPQLLPVLPHAAAAYGARVEVSFGAGAPVLAVEDAVGDAVADGSSGHLARAVHEGMRVDAGLWWRLYHRSNDALTEDTPVSRRHAGATLDPDVTDPDVDVDYVGVSS
ncbi:hypothetical protein [Nonomuraea zeae]|uniref:Uncharacterized protein n=1 Tax=Nonomuraea zeae TaxID=1642303 RepID=A0A5S4G5Y4_9ACTN|nr:hypothetical protein [Nonomuraea zeae]TMR27924.1 hypothetical protein ETD85_37480 [Nonomuraea zeae]